MTDKKQDKKAEAKKQPAPKDKSELSDEQLDQVAGGTQIGGDASATSANANGVSQGNLK
jgi:hypothetical protein